MSAYQITVIYLDSYNWFQVTDLLLVDRLATARCLGCLGVSGQV